MERGNVSKWAVALMVILGILLSGASCAVLYYNAQAAKEITLPADVEKNSEILYGITRSGRDSFKTELEYGTTQTGAGPEYLTVEGWAGVPGEDVRVFHTTVLLRDEETGTYLRLKTAWVEDGEEPDADTRGASFARGHFVAKVKADRLASGKQYRICLWYQNDGHNDLVETDQFLEK